MTRKRPRKFNVLVWLVVFVTCVSVSMSEDDVVSEANAMAKKIEEENQKVDDQTNAMVRAIENNAKNVDDSEQEKKFEKASKRVDDVMDKNEENVDIKAEKAEEIANEAERRVEELGRKIESAADFNKRSTIRSDAGMKPPQARSSIHHSFEFPNEFSVGEEIDNALGEGDRLAKAVYTYNRINDAGQGMAKINENLGINSNEQYIKEQSDVTGISDGFSKGFSIPPVEDYRQRSENYLDFENGMKTRQNSDYGKLDEYQMDSFDGSEKGEDINYEGSAPGNDKKRQDETEATNVLRASGHDDDDDVAKSSGDDNHGEGISGDVLVDEPKDEESIKSDDDDARFLGRNLYPDYLSSKRKQRETILDHIQFEINKKLQERDRSLSKVSKKKNQRQKEVLDPAASLRIEGIDESGLTNQIDPEMILRWPLLAKNYGSIDNKQEVSVISPQEVDFLQNEYPSFAMPNKIIDVLQKRRKRETLDKLKSI